MIVQSKELIAVYQELGQVRERLSTLGRTYGLADLTDALADLDRARNSLVSRIGAKVLQEAAS